MVAQRQHCDGDARRPWLARQQRLLSVGSAPSGACDAVTSPVMPNGHNAA